MDELKLSMEVEGRDLYISWNCPCGGSTWFSDGAQDFKCDQCGKLYVDVHGTPALVEKPTQLKHTLGGL